MSTPLTAAILAELATRLERVADRIDGRRRPPPPTAPPLPTPFGAAPPTTPVYGAAPAVAPPAARPGAARYGAAGPGPGRGAAAAPAVPAPPAAPRRPPPGRALRELAGEIKSGANLGGVDLVTAYPPDVLVPEAAAPAALARWMEILRDILIFSPIVLAWWQLHQALDAYGATDGKQAFLYAWQRGFSGVWTLAQTAMAVALLVLAIIMLTFVLHLLDGLASRIRLREQVARDLAYATVVIARKGIGGTPVSERSLAEFSRTLRHSIDTMNDTLRGTGSQIAAALQGEQAQRMATAASALAGSLNAVGAAAADLRRLGEALNTPTEVLQRLEALQRDIAAEGKRLHGGLAALVTQLGATAKAGESAANEQQIMTREVTDLTRTLHGWTSQSMESLGVLVHQMRDALEQVDGYGYRPGGV